MLVITTQRRLAYALQQLWNKFLGKQEEQQEDLEALWKYAKKNRKLAKAAL